MNHLVHDEFVLIRFGNKIYRSSSSLTTKAKTLARVLLKHAPKLEHLVFNDYDEFSDAVRAAFNEERDSRRKREAANRNDTHRNIL